MFLGRWTAFLRAVMPGLAGVGSYTPFTAGAPVVSPLAAAAQVERAVAWGPVEQGEWLVHLGIDARAAALARAQPARTDEIAAARMRLVNREGMGSLFRALAITAPGWPEPAGFQPSAPRP